MSTTDLRTLLGDRYGIRTPAQLAHVLSEKLDDAAPLNVTRRWLPLAEELWERVFLPDLLATAWAEGYRLGTVDAALNAVRVDGTHIRTHNPYRTEPQPSAIPCVSCDCLKPCDRMLDPVLAILDEARP